MEKTSMIVVLYAEVVEKQVQVKHGNTSNLLVHIRVNHPSAIGIV